MKGPVAPGEGDPEAPRGLAFHAPALLLFPVLSLILLYPLVSAARFGGIAGWEGDNLFYVRSLWWMKRALFDLHVAPFVDPTAYYPVGQDLSRSETSAANTILALPVTLLGGPVLAYNAMLLFSFVATGIATYLWVEKLTGRRAAGLLAGAIVAFLPFRFAHLPGHLPQLTTQWLPLTLYAFERLLERRSARRAVALGVCMALVALGSWYYGYSLALLLPIYALARTWREPGLWREAAWWRDLAVGGGVAFVLVLPFLWPMLRLSASGALHRSIGEMQSFALNFYDFFIPNLKHPLWGEAAGRSFPWQRAHWIEGGQALGYVATAAALAGALCWRRREPARVAALLAVWAASYSIALGPFLMAGDRMLRVPVPASVAQALAERLPASERTPTALEFLRTQGVPVPLPSLLLYEFVPFTRSMRVMARFGAWTGLMTGALAGFGLLALMSAVERRRGATAARAVAALAVALVALESGSRIPTMTLTPRAVDAWLARQPDDVVIVELPFRQGARPLQNYWATHNGRKSLLGWGASFPDPASRERRRILMGFPGPEAWAFLKASAATYVLVTPAQIPEWTELEPLLAAEESLAPVATLEGVRVYRFVR
jgi:hypothetical protein